TLSPKPSGGGRSGTPLAPTVTVRWRLGAPNRDPSPVTRRRASATWVRAPRRGSEAPGSGTPGPDAAGLSPPRVGRCYTPEACFLTIQFLDAPIGRPRAARVQRRLAPDAPHRRIAAMDAVHRLVRAASAPENTRRAVAPRRARRTIGTDAVPQAKCRGACESAR